MFSTLWKSLRGGISLGILASLCQLGCSRGPQYYIDKGNQFYSEGKYADAAINYRNGIKKDPRSAEARYRLGLIEQKQGNAQAAYKELLAAVELAPARDEIRIELADLVLNSYTADPKRPRTLYNQLGDAAEYFLKKDANSFHGLRLQGALSALDGKFEESLALFKRADAVKPMEPKVVLPMVQVLFRLNQTAEGEALARKCVEKQKDLGACYDVLLQHYTQAKRLEEAEALLRTKVANMPKDPQPVLQLASFYLRGQREAAMSQALQGILNNSKDFPRGNMIVGEFYANNGRWDDAIREYKAGLAANPKEPIPTRKRLAKALSEKGRQDEAIAELTEVLKWNSEDTDSQLARAILLRTGNDPKKLELAVAEFNSILAKHQNDETARYHLGLAYLAQGNSKLAHAQILESAKLSPRFLLPRITLAELAQKAGNYDEALRVSGEVLALDPTHRDARFWHAAALLGSKSYSRARAEFNALLRDYPDSPNINLHLAVLDTAEKRYSDAEARYLKFYKPGQPDLRAVEGLIQIYGQQKQLDKGLKLLDEELKKNPDSRPVHLLLAATATQAGKLDLAIQQYEWLRSNDPKSTDAYASLGDVYRLKGDINSALASYKRAKELAPNDAKIVAMIAYLESASGQYRDAIPNLKHQLSLAPEDISALNNLAFALAETGTELDYAQEIAEKAQRKAPNSPEVADTLGWVYTRKGLNDSAVQIFNGLIRKHPEVAVLRYHLGVALMQQGKQAEAKAQLTIGLSKKPPKEIADKIREIVAKLG